jgi:hypothetical protein
MWVSGTGRGASEVLGAILVFAILVSALAVFQVRVVPMQNEQVEFNGYDQARADLVELNTQVVRTAGQGTQGSATVKTGVTYPARAFALNPGAPTGSVRLTSTRPLGIGNAQAVDPDATDYWSGTLRTFPTQRFVFDPAYNRFDAAPVSSTGYLVYRLPAGGSAVPSTEQTLVRGNRLSLTAVRGDLSTAGQRVTLSTLPVSTGTETVRVTGEDTNGDGTPDTDIFLRVPTELSQATWERILDGQTGSGPNQNVESVNVAGGVAEIVLDGTKTYTLQLTKVEVRERSDDPVIADADPAYVTGVTDRRATTTGSPVTLEARVFDTFGNPVAGEEVEFQKVSANGTLGGGDTVVATDDRGVATITYAPPSDGETADIEAICADCVGNAPATRSELTVDVSEGPEAVNRPPTVEVTDLVQTNDDDDVFDVQLSVRDPDGNLGSVSARVTDPDVDEATGTSYASKTANVEGSSDTVTVTLNTADSGSGSEDEYVITVVVEDDDGLVDAESVVVDGAKTT